jgi:DNA-binding NtrC family response regulator
MAGPAVLIVEDDAPLGRMLARALEQDLFRATWVASRGEALGRVAEGGIDVMVTDLHLPDGSGVDLIGDVRRADPRIAVIAMTGFSSIELAVRAVRLGAYDFLPKPVEPAALGLAIRRAIEARSMRGEIERLKKALAAHGSSRPMVGRSRALADIVALVERAADSEASVLITGPSGSGKELVARALHEASGRSSGSFVAINAAAIPDSLIESELFGYVKGAFTDARSDREGLFQAAHGGTLFLDEIGDLPQPLQAKLLRVLQEREVRPIGATRSVPVDVRVVAATHRDLKAALAQGAFRADLYYRLAVIEIQVPPLADRPEDILPIAEHFLSQAVLRTRRPIRGFSAAAAEQLTAYPWPGNVRELENAVERAVALARDEWISPDDLPPALGEPAPRSLFADAAERLLTLEQLQRGYVRHVLERVGGNKKRAAAALGINRRTIQRWLGENEREDDEPGED